MIKLKKKKEYICPFLSPEAAKLCSIVKQNWTYMMKNYRDITKVMPAPPRICYRRSKNLRDIMVRANLPLPSGWKNFRKKQGFKICLHNRCQCCLKRKVGQFRLQLIAIQETAFMQSPARRVEQQDLLVSYNSIMKVYSC